MHIREFQHLIHDVYFDKDNARGMEATFMWLVEEVGELSRALRRKDPAELAGEFADVLAWVTTLANIAGVDLETAASGKYASGCPKCKATPCGCEDA